MGTYEDWDRPGIEAEAAALRAKGWTVVTGQDSLTGWYALAASYRVPPGAAPAAPDSGQTATSTKAATPDTGREDVAGHQDTGRTDHPAAPPAAGPGCPGQGSGCPGQDSTGQAGSGAAGGTPLPAAGQAGPALGGTQAVAQQTAQQDHPQPASGQDPAEAAACAAHNPAGQPGSIQPSPAPAAPAAGGQQRDHDPREETHVSAECR